MCFDLRPMITEKPAARELRTGLALCGPALRAFAYPAGA